MHTHKHTYTRKPGGGLISAARGFSLIELVIVVVIIGVISAIAIPRLSRGADGANDAALTANLAVLRNALDHYAAEHNGSYPALATIEDQLTKYTDIDGNVSATKTGDYLYGPYLRSIPELPVGAQAGKRAFTAVNGDTSAGWEYDEQSGVVLANTTSEKDARNKLFNNY